MNEKSYFLCIIKHKVPEVQERILSILSQKLEVIDFIQKRELSENEYLKIYGAEIPPKRRNQELTYNIILIKGDIEKVREIIGYEGSPYKSPLKSIRYMYGENEKESGIDYWNAEKHVKKVELFFTKQQIHVA